MKYYIPIVSVMIVWHCAFAGNPTSVPLTDPVYSFLDRMETAGVIHNLVDGVKPLDRERISMYLQQINLQRNALSGIDRELLDNYLLDYRYEIDWHNKYAAMNPARNWYTPLSSWQQFKHDFSRFLQRQQPEEQNHALLWEDSTNSFSFDFREEMTYESILDSVSRSRQAETYQFRGTILENFGYYVDVFMARIDGDSAYNNRDPVLKNTYRTIRGNKIYFDRSTGEIAYRSPYVDFRFAQQPISWGLGSSGKLILSDYSEQYAYLGISKYWKWGGFVFMHGKLKSEDSLGTIEGETVYPDKWITINRFEFSPWSRMAIGLTDIVVYADRGMEWVYLLPIHYFRAVEHDLYDRDNALLAIDAEVRIIKGFKLYGTWLIDELRQDKLFSNWYGNKHGFQFGMHIVDPLRVNNFELRLEYVAIMPWVYTHKYYLNRYTSQGRSLGYWAGPNSEIIYLDLTKWWHRRLLTSLTAQRWRHGANYANKNIGGDIFLGHGTLLGTQTEPVETRKFLEGILQIENRLQFQARYEVFNDVYLQLALNYILYDNSASTIRSTELYLGLKFDY